MEIRDLLGRCWLQQRMVKLTQKSTKNIIKSFKSCLELQLSNISKSDSIEIISAYLYLIGYKNIIVSEKVEPFIKIVYTLPGSIELIGGAWLLRNPYHFDNLLESQFSFIFDLEPDRKFKYSEISSKSVVVTYKDCVNIFCQVLITQLISNLNLPLRRKPSFYSWLHTYIETNFGLTKDQLNVLEKRWASLKGEKYEWFL